MPTFKLHTNVPKSQIPVDLLKELTDLLADALQKPKMYLCIHIVPDQIMSFAGTEEPCGHAFLGSIGSIGGEKNKELAKILFNKIEERLKIPQNRLYIQFVDYPANDLGFQGKTFKDIFAGN
ncbi:putative Macrophage migration inhibitory factor [Hypsibius exemplaris]|uniref:L-dopachrome isomerase n=1 Tax=Hypsibius exemplaris TaxID=2072580 RepID=A0A9X6NEI7_HYPEX|nr:putative Macrophage migration inhibitory factor [Hypsibius exemplaris]